MSNEGWKGLLLAIASAILLPVTLATAGMAWRAHERVGIVEAETKTVNEANGAAHKRIEATLDRHDEKLDRIIERLPK
jgi:hypothetical protein